MIYKTKNLPENQFAFSDNPKCLLDYFVGKKELMN